MNNDVAIDAEAEVLGGLLLAGAQGKIREVLPGVRATLDADDFCDERHRTLFAAILALDADDSEVHAVTLFDGLRREGGDRMLGAAGGPGYLAELQDRAWSWRATLPAAAVVARAAMLRRAERICTVSAEELKAGEVGDPLAYVAELHGKVAAVLDGMNGPERPQDTSLRVLVANEVLAMEERINVGDDGISTGLYDLDYLLGAGGLHAGHLVIIGARTSVGKTALAISMAINIARRGTPVAFVTNEQPGPELTRRLLSGESGVAHSKVRSPRGITSEDADRMSAAMERMAKWPLHIIDASGWTTSHIRGTVGRLARTAGIKVVFLDYLQLVQPDAPSRTSREQDVATISRATKRLAMELGVAVVALAQLSRDAEKRKEGPPAISDLRESGALEQDTDVVALLHRPDKEGTHADLYVRKNRHGPLGEVSLVFRHGVMRFENEVKPR